MFETLQQSLHRTGGMGAAGAPVSHPYDNGLILRVPSPIDPTDEAEVPREAWDWICGLDPEEVDLEGTLDPRTISHPDPSSAQWQPAVCEEITPVTTAELNWILERISVLARGGLSAEDDQADAAAAPPGSVESADPERHAASAMVDAITALESLDGARAAAAARVSLDFRTNQMQAQARAGVPASRRGRGISSQLGLARKISPHRAARDLGIAHAWITELPHTFAHLAAGRISAWAGTEVARRTAWLPTRDRAAVDEKLADQLPDWSIRQVQSATDRAVYQQAPAESVERANQAAADRHVGIRPAPECMARISALLPVAQAVAVHTALARAADTARATGVRQTDGTLAPEERTRAQIMADVMVEHVTGQSTAARVPVEVGVIMPASTLADGDQPAWIPGYGYLPAGLARELLPDSDPTEPAPTNNSLSDTDPPGATLTDATRAWLRRIFTDPDDGTITTIDSRRRVFDGALRRLLVARDGQVCRTPFCDAPIRHGDHVDPHDRGGPTALTNGQGLCERCNHAKQAPGWHQEVTHTGHAPPGLAADDPRRAQFNEHAHEVVITTPTGHRYHSTAPQALGP